jgi:hypothetical protein
MALSLGMLLFSTACEKHPLGQMPEVQREQPDPAKVSPHIDKTDATESSSSATRSEFASQQTR